MFYRGKNVKVFVNSADALELMGITPKKGTGMTKDTVINALLQTNFIEAVDGELYWVADDFSVLIAARTDIMKNGVTTTLDIKNALRQRGYWVEQWYVSEVMQRFSERGMFSWAPSGDGYNFYGFKQKAPDKPIQSEIPAEQSERPTDSIKIVDMLTGRVATIEGSSLNEQVAKLLGDL